MHTTAAQQIDTILEKVKLIPLPEEEDLFCLNVRESEGCWHVSGMVGPFARTIQDGQPFPVLCALPLSDVDFSSREEALDFAQKVHDILVERGKNPDGPTVHLLRNVREL